ncbi:MAG TPA: RidA family protein [Elusimicrobiota bacterium]|jgi:2-iminobutanoate/2-iminopropanoate deaminase|nr:RidA family protein [Elusimicrobiota bacterium]
MKSPLSTDKAPAAIGPYSQAVESGGLVFVSGQIPLDPATGALVPGGIREQTRRALANLGAILAAAGLGPADVLKTTVYLTDLSLWPAMNEEYAAFFPAPHPARAAVGVGALPKGSLVEIEAVAAKGPR